jgi:hypothetical protein
MILRRCLGGDHISASSARQQYAARPDHNPSARFTRIIGGATASGGFAGRTGGFPGTGGSSAVAGATGMGGISLTGAATTGTCGAAGSTTSGSGGMIATGGAAGAFPACLPYESCWSDGSGSRCIASTVSVPGPLGIDLTEVAP